MSVFKCKMCGGTLDVKENETVGTCEYCGTKQTLPKLIDSRRTQMYDRASHFRRANEFDKAAVMYEQILNDDNTDAEAYWSLVLCSYGIEYVEDPVSHKRVPTVNRTQYTSVFDDENYKAAIKYADFEQKQIYEQEAEAINEIQKGILEISQNEEPFDVFICYKEKDSEGRRTPDTVLANDLYYGLVNEGFKVFFSSITLEDKLGTAYEPYIFAALNSAKVMVVIGTKPEYFNAVWVKNEWSRYLALIRNGEKKVLIPAYRDMDPYDIPEEFSNLQAQDMNKLGFMQDLIRGIKKFCNADNNNDTSNQHNTLPAGSGVNVNSLLERVFLFLEDGKWKEADRYCEKVLDIEPKNPNAYLGKLMAEFNVKKAENLSERAYIAKSSNYKNAIRFSDDSVRAELEEYNKIGLYSMGSVRMKEAQSEKEYENAAEIFKQIAGYKDSDELTSQCTQKAKTLRNDEIYEAAIEMFNQGSQESLAEAMNAFDSISDWKDSAEKSEQCKKNIETLKNDKARYEAEIETWEKGVWKKEKIIALVSAIVVVFIIIICYFVLPNIN